ncbi:unnamed protein product, partial [Ilex paraguariensis]
MVVYEQYKQGTNGRYVTFIDCLLDSPKDVKILRDCGVIDNGLGDDRAVSNMFIKMTNRVN